MRPAQDHMIRNLHCFLQARPEGAREVDVQIGSSRLTALQVPAAQQALPLDVSFEELLQQLEQIPNCHTEPDGWFVWTGYVEDEFWSLNGQLTDNGERLLLVELKGDCPRSVLETLQTWLGKSARRLMLQLPQAGLFLDPAHWELYHQASRDDENNAGDSRG